MVELEDIVFELRLAFERLDSRRYSINVHWKSQWKTFKGLSWNEAFYVTKGLQARGISSHVLGEEEEETHGS